MKKMSNFKNTFFLTTFKNKGKLRCNESYYLLEEECMEIIKDIKLGISNINKLKNYIGEKYNVFNWLFVLDEFESKDILEYAFTDILIDNNKCYAFDPAVAFHY